MAGGATVARDGKAQHATLPWKWNVTITAMMIMVCIQITASWEIYPKNPLLGKIY
jgi:hypothetical protein